MNVVRGVLAEFLVARAVGDRTSARHAWSDWDVTVPNGPKIEVKSGGYLNSWTMRRLSRIEFNGLWGRRWDEATLKRDTAPTVIADVFVFAVHTCVMPASYNPRDLRQWEFYVVSSDIIKARTAPKRRISLKFVQSHSAPVPWEALGGEVTRVWAETRRDGRRE